MTTIRPELLDELLAGYERPDDLLGEEGLFKQLKKALLERALRAELSEHLGYEKGDPAGRGTDNSRNGYWEKTVLTEDCAYRKLDSTGWSTCRSESDNDAWRWPPSSGRLAQHSFRCFGREPNCTMKS